MKITLKDLDWAVKERVISSGVRDALVAALEKKNEHTPSLTFANVLYYLGGLIIIASMTLYVGMAWDDLGAAGRLGIALLYAGFFVVAGNWLWKSKRQRIPGGILITVAVCMTPMAVHAVQEMSGWWAYGDPGSYRDFYVWIKGGWGLMEIATVAAGLVALRFYRFPFITLPIAFSLWFLSMDLTAIIYGPEFSWDQRKLVSLWFGLGVLVASYVVDRRTKQDFAFWGYLFGMLAFWGGLSTMNSDSELSKFIYCCINLLLMTVSVILQRRVFIVFGALGVMGYVGHLVYDVFRNDLMFTFALSGLGLLMVALGLLYRKHEKAIEEKLTGMLPEAVRRTLPQHRD